MKTSLILICIALVVSAFGTAAGHPSGGASTIAAKGVSTEGVAAPRRAVIQGMVDIGGRSLYIHCTGEGGPTVVMDSGLGVSVDSGFGWGEVQPRVAGFARVCTYDRAGGGRSDPGPLPRTSERIVEDLHRLLAKAGIEGPYVLVGHGFGGMNIRLYAARFPREVAGMVLVDAVHEDFVNRVRPLLPPPVPGESPRARPGLARMRWQLARASYPKSNVERVDLRTSAAQVYAADSLIDIPLAVVMHNTPRYAPEYPRGIAARLERARRGMQGDLARMSPNSKLIVGKTRDHSIHRHEADLVADAVRQVVTAAREGSPLCQGHPCR